MNKFINFVLRVYAPELKTRNKVQMLGRNVCVHSFATDKPLSKNAALIRALTTFAKVFDKTICLPTK
jgi:hypothetical protein